MKRILPVVALALALASGASPATSQTEMTTLRIASTPIDVGAEVYYAQALGMFKQAGLDVQIQSIDNGAAIAAAVAGGAADIGQSNVVSLPAEDEPPLVVHADRVQPLEVAFEPLEPVARRRSQVEH